MAGSLRDRKIEALRCILNFNDPDKRDDPQWKILVYDRVGQDIIAPLFTVKELRALGVTLHLLLDTKREAIPDVPAIYFVYPSPENIKRICSDFEADLYDAYYLNFVTPIPREQLEILAENALAEECIPRIQKVFDQYAKFVCLEDDLFTLSDLPVGTYYTINKTNCDESEIQMSIGSIVESLFSVFATLGTVPIIRCSRVNAAEMVAKHLDSRFRDSLRDSRNTLFTGVDQRVFGDSSSATGVGVGPRFSFQRPLLIILDRGLDLATPLHHGWTYQSLVQDIIGIKLNHIDLTTQQLTSLGAQTQSSETKTKRYDLSSTSDRLWRDHRVSPFSEVAGALQEQLAILQNREKQLGALKASVTSNGTDGSGGGFGTGEVMGSFQMTDTTSALSSTINTLPQLMEQKRCLDMHMSIATHLAKEIKARQLDLLNDVEEKILSQQTVQEYTLSDLLQMNSFSSEDKMRLLLLAALSSSPSSLNGSGGSSSAAGTVNTGGASSTTAYTGSSFTLSSSDLDQLTNQLVVQYPDLDTSAVRYVHHIRRLAKLSLQTTAPGADSSKTYSGRGMFNKLVSHGSAMLFEGMRSLVSRKSYLPFTEIVSQLVENKSDLDDYGYFDPKLYRRTDVNSMPRSKQPFSDVYVFVVGGGTYVEYHNLLDWARSTSRGSGSGVSVGQSGAGSGGIGSSIGLGHSASGSSLNALGLTISQSASSVTDLVASATSSGVSRHITYGGTEILTPNGFLDQLTRLGKEV